MLQKRETFSTSSSLDTLRTNLLIWHFFFLKRTMPNREREQTRVSSRAEEGSPTKCSCTLINHVSERDDSGPPASSMAAVSLGSWFPALGQRSSSCGPSPPHTPRPPLALPLTQQMWSDHHGEGPRTSGSDYGQTIQLYQLLSALPSAATHTLPRGEV